MDDLRIGPVFRALRHRLSWTQAVVATKAGVSQQLVSRVERGDIGQLTVDTLRKVAASLGMRLALDPQWRGPSLDRLLEFDHSRLAQSVKTWLERWKWLVEVEVTFSRYGERGSIDLLAFHPTSGILLVIEIKTMLPDLQAMLRSLDAKMWLARGEAARFGWNPTAVVPCLVLMETSTNRRRVSEHSPWA